MMTGASGHPSASSRTAYEFSQIFAAVEAAPLGGAPFFVWLWTRVAAKTHRHSDSFLIVCICGPLVTETKAIVQQKSGPGKCIVWSSPCLHAALEGLEFRVIIYFA